ncbi:MAG: glycosyltransferase family 2 protein [Phycisphaerae bacterium]|nr:glycosyltransferase family 2 protein [Phycisphaerae bacterium]
MQDSFIIITPAFNEAAYIEQTIQSVVAQTRKPLLWVIVDDGSTDQTADIVKQYAQIYAWIQYVYRSKETDQTYYASNVYAIQRGLEVVQNSKLKTQNVDYFAVLDADVELCPDYYEKIFQKFKQYPKLGIATGTYLEQEGSRWKEAKIDRRSTPKAIQVFKGECYEKCGGYIPFRYGGEDSGMEIMARMNGWQTWSFNDIVVKHLRPVGTGDGRSLLKARYRMGFTDYFLATHPLFMVFKCVKRAFWEKPYILSSLARLLGYVAAYLKKENRQLPDDAKDFIRAEQMNRLLNMIKLGKKLWQPE